MLCEKCHRFQDDIGLMISQGAAQSNEDSSASSTFWPSYETTLFKSVEELEAANKSPCIICRCVSQSLAGPHLAEHSNGKCITVLVFAQSQGKPVLIARFEDHTIATEPVVKQTKNVTTFTTDLESKELWRTLDRCAVLENDSTGSAASFELATYWLRDCLTNHPDCLQATPEWLPTRVVDVGSNSFGTPQVKLLETADLPPGLGNYERTFVALSHCWGTKQIITTKKQSLEDHKRGIPEEELSQTFRDAVEATRRFGQRFIWIDSLCIIQDSDEDWKTQSVQMCKIYQQAIFTIMAAHASSGDEGCFVTRDGLIQLPFQLHFKDPARNTIATASFKPIPRPSSNFPFSRSLFTRAWVLQEQAISRARLIYFGEQIHWECQTMRGCESDPNGGTVVSGLAGFTRTITTADDPFTKEKIEETEHFRDHLHTQWCILVENYMQRGITKTSDRLIAVDGIAQAIRKRTSNQYLAGLWLDQLPIGLMWYIPWDSLSNERWRKISRSAKTYLSSRHEKPLAPTWSWASVTFPVEWPFSNAIMARFVETTVLCETLHAHVQGTPFDQTGTIAIRGMIRRLYVDPFFQDIHFLGKKEKNPKLQEYDIRHRDYRPNWAWTVCHASTVPRPRDQFPAFALEFFADEPFDCTQQVTFFALTEVPPTQWVDPDSFFSTRPSTFALALLPTGRKPNEYHRIGFAQFRNCSWYGYFCVGDKYEGHHWERLKAGKIVGGWSRIFIESFQLCILFILGTIFRQSVVWRPRDGLVWFRELKNGDWSRHSHDTSPHEDRSYREGWEPERETITIV